MLGEHMLMCNFRHRLKENLQLYITKDKLVEVLSNIDFLYNNIDVDREKNSQIEQPNYCVAANYYHCQACR